MTLHHRILQGQSLPRGHLHRCRCSCASRPPRQSYRTPYQRSHTRKENLLRLLVFLYLVVEPLIYDLNALDVVELIIVSFDDQLIDGKRFKLIVVPRDNQHVHTATIRLCIKKVVVAVHSGLRYLLARPVEDDLIVVTVQDEGVSHTVRQLESSIVILDYQIRWLAGGLLALLRSRLLLVMGGTGLSSRLLLGSGRLGGLLVPILDVVEHLLHLRDSLQALDVHLKWELLRLLPVAPALTSLHLITKNIVVL